MSAIEIFDLTLNYGNRTVIADFNATIESGEFIGIFGPNGAGKSTLLRAILGLIKPYSGSIQIFGRPVHQGDPEIGYLAQTLQSRASHQLSGRTRIAASLNGQKWGLPLLNKNQKQEITRILKLLNAEEYADRPYTELSGGERQRLLLAQALLHKPRVLLLDEPLTNLDPRYQESLIQIIKNIQQTEKVTVLFTAHDLNPLLGVMDRIIYLARGKGAIGSIDEIVTDKKLSWLYGTPIEVIRHQQRLYVISQERGELADDNHHHATDINL